MCPPVVLRTTPTAPKWGGGHYLHSILCTLIKKRGGAPCVFYLADDALGPTGATVPPGTGTTEPPGTGVVIAVGL